ncbi:MAG: ABC transporter ATP-binding protein [Desulfobacterales bacterium]|nr:ABC transporter ATP-binding protein [Desulfobacterales bacterium]
MYQDLIELRNITKIYGEGHAAVHALDHIDLRIRRGEFVAMMGPSGSGKSTCLNILGCLDSPTGGSYRFDDVQVESLSLDQRAALRRNFLGFIFQGFNLLNRTSALENVELPLIYRRMPVRKRRELALKALDDVGLAGWAEHTPGELSGGQQQRVAIARALVGHPKVLLADEPTGNLDSARSKEVMEMLSGFNRRDGVTIVMVTHEPDMAAYADRQIQFRDGVIEAVP